jgi:glycosyltransferase involved in cell wall biosynthesis
MAAAATPISVIVPFYRAMPYFGEMLRSVIEQGDRVAEILVIVDGPDADAERHLAATGHPKLRIEVLPSNRGSAAARNRGLQLASCPLIAMIDADDVWLPEKLERQLAFMEAHPQCDVCHTAVEVFRDDGAVIARHIDKPEWLRLAHLLEGNQVLTSSMLVKRSALEAVDGYDETYRSSQDFELIFRLLKQGARIGFLPEVLTQLRRSGHGHVSSNGPLLLRNHLRIAWHYRCDLQREGGTSGWLRFVARYLREDGSKTPGLRGRLLAVSGRLLQALSPRIR